MADDGANQPPAPIAAEAPPNRLPNERLLIRPVAEPPVGDRLRIDPATAGWRYLAFRVAALAPGTTTEVGRSGWEHAVVLVSGPAEVVSGGRTYGLASRATPFDGGSSAVYLPPDVSASVVVPAGARPGSSMVAIVAAPGSGRPGVAGEPRRIAAGDCWIEIRGAGNATRQISHIITPEFPADRLLIVEVVTPAGNWSSWPPHKHDVEAGEAEAVLEEIYYYRFRRPQAWGVQRVYRRPGTPLALSSGPRDALFTVHDGDAVLVTDGYHPFTATHGDEAWYLNALAGDRRTMACSFDPAHVDEMAAWPTMAVDLRVPLAGVPSIDRDPGA